MGKPKIRLGAARTGNPAFGFALVEKLAFGRIVTAENKLVIPPAEITDYLQVIRARREASGVCGGESSWKFPERTVHCHEEVVLSNVANPRPFGVPTMR